MDLSSLKSVTSAAQTFLSRESELHILFANASTLSPDPAERSAEGYEASFATATLGHHAFTMALLEALDGGARVVTTSSYAAHDVYKPKRLNFDTLEGNEGIDWMQVRCWLLPYSLVRFLNQTLP